MFGLSKEKPAVDHSVGQGGERYPEHLETLALAAGEVAAEKADELAATFADEHQRQLSGYVFDCRRHGDFLSLFVTRTANKPGEWTAPEHGTSYSTTINLARVKAIRLTEGHGPDRGLSMGFGITLVSERGGRQWGTGQGMYAPPKGSHWETAPLYPHLPTSRASFFLAPEPPKDNQHWGQSISMGDSGYSIKHKVPDFPRPAQDDEIAFDGLGATLFVPHSKGHSVLAAILAEIERAAPLRP